jgi:hypothetical protein
MGLSRGARDEFFLPDIPLVSSIRFDPIQMKRPGRKFFFARILCGAMTTAALRNV